MDPEVLSRCARKFFKNNIYSLSEIKAFLSAAWMLAFFIQKLRWVLITEGTAHENISMSQNMAEFSFSCFNFCEFTKFKPKGRGERDILHYAPFCYTYSSKREAAAPVLRFPKQDKVESWKLKVESWNGSNEES